MSTLAHAQGGPRPAFSQDHIFHPGLQVHAIQEPKGDRRLSLLISAFCYTAMAGLVALTVQHREAIKEKLSTLPRIVLFEPVEAQVTQLRPAPAAAPPAGQNVGPENVESIPHARIQDVVPNLAPETLPSIGQNLNGFDPNLRPGSGRTGPVGEGGSHETGTGHTPGNGTVADISMTQVMVLHQAEPVYPLLARLTKVQGDVVVRMTIDTTGTPSAVRVVSGPEVLRAEALRCARLWRFTPALEGSQRIPAAFNLTLRFLLRS